MRFLNSFIAAHDDLADLGFVHHGSLRYDKPIFIVVIIRKNTIHLEQLLQTCAPRVFYRVAYASPTSSGSCKDICTNTSNNQKN